MPTATQTVVETVEGPVFKRRKIGQPDSSSITPKRKRPKIFAPFRTVGLVSPTDVPFTSAPRGKTTFQITTSVGRTLQTYDLKRGLNLVFLTRPQTPENITATLASKQKVYAAWGGQQPGMPSGVWVFQRGKKVDELQMPTTGMGQISQLLEFGSWIVGRGETRIEVWKSSTLEHYTSLISRDHGAGARLSGGICSMPTYLNKIFAGRANGCVEIWNVSTGRLLYTIRPSSPEHGAVSAVEPSPALSLIAIAYQSGLIKIHNVRTDQTVLILNKSTSNLPPVMSISFRTDEFGAGEDGQSSGVMATASRENGDVIFWDLGNGGRRMGVLRGAHSPPSKTGDIAGGINKVSFLSGQAVLVTSGLDNSLKTWIFDQIPFSPVPRILHQRSGHAAPVSSIQFLPVEADSSESVGKWLLSGSEDRSLWGWSLWRDGQSTEISQGAIEAKARKRGLMNNSLVPDAPSLETLKAPPITAIACCMNRDGGIGALPGKQSIWAVPGKEKKIKDQDAETAALTGWESIVTAHAGNNYARTWFWGRKRAGRWMLKTGDGAEVSTVAMSPCGTFALIGSAGGTIVMYNLQSGIQRQQFPVASKPLAKHPSRDREPGSLSSLAFDTRVRIFSPGEGKHSGRVTGVEIDNLNQRVFSCGEDGLLKFWSFNGLLEDELDFSVTSITGMRYHRLSDLIAVNCTDGYIRVVDITTRKLVRELNTVIDPSKGIKRTLDFCFSPDGRWILASSEDRVLRIWDLSTGHLIEALRFRSVPKAIAFSPTGEFLATSHDDSVGITIWTNRTIFTHVSTRQIEPTDIVDIEAPNASGEGGQNMLEAAFTEDQPEELDDKFSAPTTEQLSKELLTLSLVPKPRWQTLLHLDIVRQRNKPIEPPQKPKAAPFFLPSLNPQTKSGIDLETPSTSSALIVAGQESSNTAAGGSSKSRISKISDPTVAQTSIFTVLLRSQSLNALISHLASLPPASADLAIRTLDPAPPYTELVTFLNALTKRLRDRRDYELVQTWIAVFLRCHKDALLESEEVRDALRRWREENARVERAFGETVGFCRGVSGWVGGVV